MTREEMQAEFDKFFEFPGDDRSQVTSVSCRLFAEHIARLTEGRDVITLTVKQAQSMSDTLKVVAGSVDNKGAASAINSIADTLRKKIEESHR